MSGGISHTFWAATASGLRLVAHLLFFAPSGVMAAANWCERQASGQGNGS